MPPVQQASIAAQDEAARVFSQRQFRDAMGQFATGVVVISTERDGEAHAMTANAFMSGSLQPPLVMVSVACTARACERIRAAGTFGVSILACTQQLVSNHFAGKPSADHSPAFERLDGLPVVAGASVQITADVRHEYPCGDHALFVGEVRALRNAAAPAQPLLFHSGRYGRIAAADWSADALPEGFWSNHEYRW